MRKKYFIKKINHEHDYYGRYISIYEILKKNNLFYVPKPIKKNKTILYFENIGEHKTLHEIIKKRGKISKDEAVLCGKIIGVIHNKFNQKSKKGFLHGDYWLRNILFKKDKIYIIDFEAPNRKLHKPVEKYISGHYTKDLAIFVYKIITFHYFKNIKSIINNCKEEVNTFLCAYEEERNFKINTKLLLNEIYECYYDEQKELIRKKNILRLIIVKFLLKKRLRKIKLKNN